MNLRVIRGSSVKKNGQNEQLYKEGESEDEFGLAIKRIAKSLFLGDRVTECIRYFGGI